MTATTARTLFLKGLDVDLTALWIRGIRLVLSLLILTILLALTGGIIKTLLDLALLWRHPVEIALRHIIIDTLIVLAVVEVFKTTLTYFSEIISEWFKGMDVHAGCHSDRDGSDSGHDRPVLSGAGAPCGTEQGCS